MPENRKTEEILNGLMKNNREVTRVMGLDARKKLITGVVEGMGNVKKDIRNWKGYQKEAFLKAVDKQRLGFRAENAIHKALEVAKPVEVKSKINESEQRRKEYNAIMSKRKGGSHGNVENVNLHENPRGVDLSAGNRGVRRADGLLGQGSSETSNYGRLHQKRNDENEGDIKNRLKDIQSLR
ncbi:MAG: hypothetical protein ACD_8C00083G0002 [uncultured bacterium]|nr:MAG: hypothetical protein ACD_8C00083G0002 [uncultured bacterium]